MPTTACRAPPASSAVEWVDLGRSHLEVDKSLARAAACFSDAALADPLSHQPPLYSALTLLQDGTRHDRVNEAAMLLLRLQSSSKPAVAVGGRTR